MAVFVLPPAYIQYPSAKVDSEDTFAGASTITMGATTWTLAVAQVVGVDQLDTIATCIEQLIQQDFEGLPAEDLSKAVDATSQGAALTVTVSQTNDLPTGVSVGAWSVDLGTGRSLAALIRERGYGTEWTP